MRLFRECMRLFHGSKSAHQLSVHVRWESNDTPLGTNNQSQQLYHRLFDLKKPSMEATRTARCRSAVCQSEPSARAMAKPLRLTSYCKSKCKRPEIEMGLFT